MFDGKAFGAEIVRETRAFVERALAPALARLAELEAHKPVDGRAGADGADGRDGAPGRDGRDGQPGATGAAGEKGADGRDGVDGRDGSDGLAGVSGADGRDGKDGRDGSDGQAGRDGVDGRDGFGFDDLEVSHDGERGFAFRFMRGDHVREFSFVLPVVLDRGVFKAETRYARGDAVTWGGSLWIAQVDTTAKPESGADWRLAVKRGRDGKDGAQGPQGTRGADGRPGRDLTQMSYQGERY